MRRTLDSKPMDRAMAALLIALISTLGCPPPGERLAPAAGLWQKSTNALSETGSGRARVIHRCLHE